MGGTDVFAKNQLKLFNQNVKKLKSMMINQKTKRKMMKVSQNLPMMPNFGGECKTTGLEKIAAQLA